MLSELHTAPRTVAEMFAGGGCQYITGDIHGEHEFGSDSRHEVARADGGVKKLVYNATHAARCHKAPQKRLGGVKENAGE